MFKNNKICIEWARIAAFRRLWVLVVLEFGVIFSVMAEPVKIGVLAFRPKPQTLAQWQPLERVLKRAIPQHDFVVEALTFPELNAAVANKKLDFILTNSGHYVLLAYRNGLSSPLATLSVLEQGRPVNVFGGVIFTRADASELNSLKSLRGKKIATTSIESLGGYQMQALELKQAGLLLPKAAKLILTGMPHDNVVSAVLSGKADAGFVRTGVLEGMGREGKLDLAKIKIINSQTNSKFPYFYSTRLYPEWPFVALPHSDGELARQVAAALFLLHENSAEARGMQIQGFSIPVDYTPVADMLRELRMPPFDDAPEFTLRDVWNQYRIALIAAILAAAMIVYLTLRLLWTNRKLEAEQQHELEQRQQLQENESRFRYMLETSPIAVRIASLAGNKVLFSNQRYAELIEAPPESVAGIDPRVYYANPQDYAYILALLAQGESVNNQLIELRISGGKIKWVLASYLILKYGEETAVLGWFFDITERKQIESALRDSQARLTEAQRVAQLGSWMLDLRSNILEWSAEVFRIFEIDQSQFGASYEAFLNAIHPADREAVNGAYLNSLKDQSAYEIEHRLLFPDGRVKFVHERCESEFDAQGKAFRSLGTVQDISERRQLQGIEQLFQGINQQLLQGKLIDEVFEYICIEVVNIFNFQYAWIGSKEINGLLAVRAALKNRAELEQIGVRWDDPAHSKGPTGAAIRTGQMQILKTTEPLYPSWLEEQGPGVFLALPLIVRGDIYGVLTLYSKYAKSFDEPETLQRLSGIVSRICVAVETAQDQQQLELLRNALSASANGVFVADKAGRILWVNNAFTTLTGYGEDEAIGLTPRLLNSGKESSSYYETLWATILRGEVWRNEMQNKRKDGGDIYLRQTITPIMDAQGKISHFIAILEDISERKIVEARIEHMAHYDALTNLPNRALFMDRLRRVLVSAKRGRHKIALMFLDLDGFKSVNDTFGHQAGDQLLQQVAARLSACVRESDTVSRLAGDEFTVILPEITSGEDAAQVAQKIIDSFAKPFDLEGVQVHSSTSIGIALYPQDAIREEGLLKQADRAMYVAKQEGKNKFVFCTRPSTLI